MTDREKIIGIIDKWANKAVITQINGASVYDQNNASELTKALLAANIGDVTEWKEKVACAKRILQIPTLPNGTTDLSYFEYKGERIQDIVRQRDEYKRRIEACRIATDKIYDYCCEEAIAQAEREITGEKND